MNEIRIYNSYNVGEIIIDPTSVKAEGAPEYARLIVPCKFSNLTPILAKGMPQEIAPFTIFNVRCNLCAASKKIADALPSTMCLTVNGKRDYNDNLEFYLDPYRIKKIEEIRKYEPLKTILHFYFNVAIYNQRQEYASAVDANIENRIVDITPCYVIVSVDILQSHWADNVLPKLGYNDYFIVELPKENKVIHKAWACIEQAEHALGTGDVKSVFAHCREANDLITNRFGKNLQLKEGWSRFLKNGFSRWASWDLHEDQINKGTPTKTDAEQLLIVAKSFIKYAEELLRENKPTLYNDRKAS